MIAAALDDADRDKIATMPRLRRLSSYTTFNPTAFIYGQDPPARSAKSCLVRIRPDLDPSSPLKTTPLDGVITVVLGNSRSELDFTSSQVTKSRASTYGDDRKRARSIVLQSPPHAVPPGKRVKNYLNYTPPRAHRISHLPAPSPTARSREIKGEFWQGRWGVAAKKPSGHVQEYLEDRDFARQDQKFAGADLAEIGYR
ncbi:hypothetical protein NHJ13734_009382 [Beauveria thailandica]